MDQYMALSKKDLMIHITLNELYNTHSLILQHIETLVRSIFFFDFNCRSNSWHSRQTTSNIYAYLPMNWVPHLLKFLAKRTEQSNFLFTVDGRRLYTISKAHLWIQSLQLICFTWRPSLSLSSLYVLSRASLTNNHITLQPLPNELRRPRMLCSSEKVSK